VNQQQNSSYNVLSILGFIFAFIIPPVGFVLGIIALSHIKKTGEKGKGLAIAAVVLGAIFFLFLILLIFVGMMWIVVRNTVQEGSNQVTMDSKCLEANVVVTEVTNLGNGVFDVTLARQGGEDQIGGVKLAFTNNDETSSYVADVSGNIRSLMSKTASVSIPAGALANPTKVSVVVYFLDDSQNEQLCNTANQLSF
jgi:hypothetical protein